MFTDEQKRLILAADDLSDQQTDLFLEMTQEGVYSNPEKQVMLDRLHGMALREIDLLEQAGDPGATARREKENLEYMRWRESYDPVEQRTIETEVERAARLFNRARLEVIWERNGRAKSDSP